jgi:hypothetical protein
MQTNIPNPSGGDARRVIIKISDATGHTTLQQTIDESVKTVMDQWCRQGMWPYLNTERFEFEAKNQDSPEVFSDMARLKEAIEDAFEEGSTEIVITLTGPLIGGGYKVTFTIDDDGTTKPAAGAAAAKEANQVSPEEVARMVRESLERQLMASLPTEQYRFSDLKNAGRHSEATLRLLRRLVETNSPVRVTLVDDREE